MHADVLLEGAAIGAEPQFGVDAPPALLALPLMPYLRPDHPQQFIHGGLTVPDFFFRQMWESSASLWRESFSAPTVRTTCRGSGWAFSCTTWGKCKIPLEILNKPGALTPEERKIINRHPEEGSKLLNESGYATEEAEIIVLQHHERDNGKGYPYGLNGREIHPYARICRLADVYEALTSDRPYHRKRTTFEALKLIKEEMSDLDQGLINCFIKLFA